MALTQNKRDPSLDAIRALAIIMVVAIHVTSSSLMLPVGSGGWWCALGWGSLIRPAVPLFFMCSGAVMLNRDHSLKDLFGKKILHIVIVMLFWAFAAHVYRLLPDRLTLDGLWGAVKQTLLLQHESHFYYLHILLLVYAFIPVTRVFTRSATRRDLEYFLLFWFLTGILIPLLRYYPPISLMFPFGNWYMMTIAYASVGYGILGHYLRQYSHTVRPFWYILSLVGGAAIVFVGTAVSSLRSGSLVELYLDGWCPGAMFFAVGLFGLLRCVNSWPARLIPVMTRLSGATLCIYMVHGLFLKVLEHFGLFSAAWMPLVSIPLLTLLILALSWIVYEVMSRIPIVKTWLI